MRCSGGGGGGGGGREEVWEGSASAGEQEKQPGDSAALLPAGPIKSRLGHLWTSTIGQCKHSEEEVQGAGGRRRYTTK